MNIEYKIDYIIDNNKKDINNTYLFKFIGNCTESFYIGGIDVKKTEEFQYGVIINVNNITYLCTTYLPNDCNYKIFFKDQEIKFSDVYSQFIFDITIYKIDKFDVELFNITKYNGNIKSKKKINTYIDTGSHKIEIPLNNFEYKLIDTKHPSLPKNIVLSVKMDDTSGYQDIIYPGNCVYKMINSKKYLLGIVSYTTPIDDNQFEIIIIPTYTILQVIKSIKNKKIVNIWSMIDDNGKIIKKYNNIYDQLLVDDIIKMVDNNKVIDGKIKIKILDYDVPIQTFIWYNQYFKKSYYFNITLEDRKIRYPYKNIDLIMAIPFHHNNETITLNISKVESVHNITFQTLSFELIEFLTTKSMYISNDMMRVIFSEPFDTKINNTFIANITNNDKMRLEFLSNIILQDQLESKQIDIYHGIPIDPKHQFNSLIDMKVLFQRFKTRGNIDNININLTYNENVIDNFVLNIK